MLAQMLAPAAVLVAWSIVILFWMAFTRLPALGKAGGLGNAKPGGRGQPSAVASVRGQPVAADGG